MLVFQCGGRADVGVVAPDRTIKKRASKRNKKIGKEWRITQVLDEIDRKFIGFLK